MALLGLHLPHGAGVIHPIIGRLNATTGLTGFTDTYVPFGHADGGLTESANLTYDGTTLDVHGGNCEAAIFKSNNYQNAAGTRSIVYNTGLTRWYVSNNLGIAGILAVAGAATITGITHCDNKVEFTSTTEYIDQEIW